jgi:hypothetical protein
MNEGKRPLTIPRLYDRVDKIYLAEDRVTGGDKQDAASLDQAARHCCERHAASWDEKVGGLVNFADVPPLMIARMRLYR